MPVTRPCVWGELVAALAYAPRVSPMSDIILPDACQRVAAFSTRLGLNIQIQVMGASTRTAEDAAQACDCEVAQIVKSLVFTGRDTGTAYLLLVSGVHRVDQDAVAVVVGEALDRPNGRAVRDITGFAIGGIPPFAHAQPMKTFMDRHLLRFDLVWAAAGTPLSVFAIAPSALQVATQATPFHPAG